MRNWKLILGVCGGIAAAGLFISALAWSSVPDPMPIHWDASGHPNGWASRTFGLLFSPALGVVLSALLAGLLGRDEKTTNVAPHFAIGSAVFALGLHLLIVQAALHPSASLSMAGMSVLLGLLFSGMGLIMPRLSPNRWAGIRLPWTMKDETVWKLTHRFAGKAFVVAGILAAITGALLPAPWAFVSMFSSIMIGTIAPTVYSYMLHRARRERS